MRQLGTIVIVVALLTLVGSRADAALPGLAPPPDLLAGGPRDMYEVRLGKPPRALQPAGGLGHSWAGDPPYIAGLSWYSQGEFIYSDTPFDDTGADTVPDSEAVALQEVYAGLCDNTGAYRHGDYTYPSDPAYGRNAADLVELRLAADNDWYYVLFRLQTLIEARTTVVALAIDADANPATGRSGWPGFEHVLEVHGVGVDGVAATLNGRPVEARVDLTENAFEARVPREALPGGTWRVAAAAGTWNGVGWTAVVDLAFVEEPIGGVFNCWLDKRQSQLIAAGTFPVREVDTEQLRQGRQDEPPLSRGPMVRLHAPSINLGEGIADQPKYNQGSDASIYRGTLQPYAAYVPSTYDPQRDNPLIMLLHCLNCNHQTFFIAAWPGLKDLAESRGALIVTPLAYGEGGHYEEEAEWDVFDVLADVSTRYRIDRERLYLTGMSMGALGTFRLGLLYPDLWARAFSIGNYTNPFCVTPSQKNPPPFCPAPFNYFTILDNAHNVPWGLINGALDELTPVTGAREIADRFTELGYAFRYWEYATRRHEPSLHGLTTDVTDPFLGNAHRVTDPARVTYLIDRAMQNEPWHLTYDRAYWLRDIRLAAGAARGSAEALSGRGTAYTTVPVSGSGTSAAGPYTMRGLDPVPAAPSGRNELRLSLRSIASLTVYLADAGLSTREPLTLTVDTDTPVTVSLQGHGGTLTFPPGTTTVVLPPG